MPTHRRVTRALLLALPCLGIACGGRATSTHADASTPTSDSSTDSSTGSGHDGGARDTGGAMDATQDANTCDAPSQVTYSCTPVSADGSTIMGCRGGPTQAGTPDPDAIFPSGCNATLAMCTPSFPDEAQTCMCGEFPTPDGGMLTWICPL